MNPFGREADYCNYVDEKSHIEQNHLPNGESRSPFTTHLHEEYSPFDFLAANVPRYAVKAIVEFVYLKSEMETLKKM